MDSRTPTRLLRPILLGLLCLPLAVQSGLALRGKPLAGAFTSAPRPRLSWGSWFAGSFATGYEAWHNQNFGLRSTVVRIYNQEGRTLFGVARANNIEIGTRDVLYDKESIMASRGDPVPQAEINALADQLAALHRALLTRGITLVVGIAPGKATYWPEDVSPQFGPQTRESSGSMLAKALASRGDFSINWIDRFRERRKTDPWPLFPKTGMHWSRYAAARAIDDLAAEVERHRGIDLPDVTWEAIKPANKPIIPDDDVGGAMNLLFPISPGLLAEPEIEIGPADGKARPSMLVLGDSFFWTMLSIRTTRSVQLLSPGLFSGIDYRFYNRERHRFGATADAPEDAAEAMMGHDVVLILGSDSMGLRMGWGFVPAALRRLAPGAGPSARD